MLKLRHLVIAIGLLAAPLAPVPASAEVSISIGFNLSNYPDLEVVPGYPVYYAPRIDANFFFYDSLYWVYRDDRWYSSSWYNGPWWYVEPDEVPLYVLRVPVRYYRQPPSFFLSWRSDAPPRWGDHWGRDWQQRHNRWDRWDRRTAPKPAPLPVYQRQYQGDRYPGQVEQQHRLIEQNYRYQPRDPVVRQHYDRQAIPRAPETRAPNRPDAQRAAPPRAIPAAPRAQPPQEPGHDARRSDQATPPGRDQAQQQHPSANQGKSGRPLSPEEKRKQDEDERSRNDHNR
ncbi:MAG: hypothetical protein HGA75_18570 [Thiobacillus sp.]|nr:hypothetical protein [Thiobacillus sp.]